MMRLLLKSNIELESLPEEFTKNGKKDSSKIKNLKIKIDIPENKVLSLYAAQKYCEINSYRTVYQNLGGGNSYNVFLKSIYPLYENNSIYFRNFLFL